MKRRSRRTKIEWAKAYIAFTIFLLAVSGIDSNILGCGIVGILSLLYLRIVALRLEQRGEI